MNAGKAGHLIVRAEYSRMLEDVLLCLKANGYISDVMTIKNGNKPIILVLLKYYTNNSNAKMYADIPVLSDFYEKNTDAVLNSELKFRSPKISSQYQHVIKTVNFKSKGSVVIYSAYRDLAKHRDRSSIFGIMIVSTPKGIMSHMEAVEQRVGGQILLAVY